MTFVPLLAYYVLRPPKRAEATIAERRSKGFTGRYARVATWAIRNRWKVLLGSFVFLAFGVLISTRLKSLFFPDDLQYWATVDVRLPNDSSVALTNRAAQEAERVIRETAKEFGRQHPSKDGKPVLHSITSFVGGGGPRFWFSVSPEIQQPNYAQLFIHIEETNQNTAL